MHTLINLLATIITKYFHTFWEICYTFGNRRNYFMSGIQISHLQFVQNLFNALFDVLPLQGDKRNHGINKWPAQQIWLAKSLHHFSRLIHNHFFEVKFIDNLTKVWFPRYIPFFYYCCIYLIASNITDEDKNSSCKIKSYGLKFILKSMHEYISINN